MSDHLVRVENLRNIQRSNEWNDSELGRQCGRSPQQVRSWLKGERQIGERLARALEERLGLARYALDERPQPPQAGAATSDRPLRGNDAANAKTRSKEVPVLVWADIKAMINVENAVLKQKAPHLETFAPTSTRAKFLEMPDDSMAGEIQAGDHLLFDPTEAPRAGDIVLVEASGEHFIRLFRPRTAFVFEAAAINPAYQALTSENDGLRVIGVMVEHRRYRRLSR